jgi:hypothetical protein
MAILKAGTKNRALYLQTHLFCESISQQDFLEKTETASFWIQNLNTLVAEKNQNSMRKIILSTCTVVLLFTSSLFAQRDDDKNKPSLLTLTAGWSYADLVQGDVTTDTRSGLFVGVRKAVKIVPMVHFETGLLYAQKGATVKFEGVPDQEFKLDYLDIPLAVKGVLGPVYGIAGVSGNIRLKSEINDTKVESVKGFDLTSQIGVGFTFLMLSLDLRWNRSLMDIASDNPGENIYNSYLLVGLGFNINRK